MEQTASPAAPATPAETTGSAGDSVGVQTRSGTAPAGTAGTTQPAGNGAPAQAPAETGGGLFGGPFIWILLLALLAFNLFGNRGRKKQQARVERLKSLEKGDRVLTIGQMHGTVVALTDDTMTLKPDEHAGFTMLFDRKALYEILPRPGEAAAGEAEKKQ